MNHEQYMKLREQHKQNEMKRKKIEREEMLIHFANLGFVLLAIGLFVYFLAILPA